MSKPSSGLFHGTKGDVAFHGDAESVIASRVSGLDLREHPPHYWAKRDTQLDEGGADFFLYQPYRAYPKDLRYSLGLIHPRERFRRCSQ